MLAAGLCAVRSGAESALPASSIPDAPRARPAWIAALAAERAAFLVAESDPAAARDDYRRAIRAFERVARLSDVGGDAYWRSARCHWFLGELTPPEDEDERLAHYEDAEREAARGLARDPDCAGCMLWKFTAMGRLVMKRGLLWGLRGAPEMAALLERGIALHPTHRDTENNSTLGNLHYGSAIFYRVLPDWGWLGWLLGVRGDKERALAHARQALALHPGRVDYRVELGSQLVCLGTSRSQPARLDEGRGLLEQTVALETSSDRDARQQTAARIMLEHPEKACGFMGDDWVEIDEWEAAAVARRDR